MKILKKHIYFSTAANASFHAFISTGYLQTVDMRYNIRGQLLSMNNSKLSNDGGVTNNDNTDLFGMQFYYDQANSNLNTTPKYNGRMTGVTWMSTDAGGNKSYERAFSYYYDNINRDTAAIYSERPTASTTAFTITHGWDENRITYDGNGNIQTMFRMYASQGAGNHVPIDNLTYTYSTTSPNQLSTVTDATGNNAGFYNLTSSTTPYTYDANGNLTNDYYKGLGISYNFLNKTGTTTVTTGTNQYINYTYDGAGILIRKQAYNNGTLQTTTDYIDGFVYVNSTLSYFPMPEGRVVNVSGILKQEFILKDQQGNARLAFQDSGNGTPVVTQENSYYAFGLIMPNSPVATPGNANKQLYNGGSEWQNDYSNLPDYYQTFNRNYDAALGRFVGVDLQAESAESMTSYNYAGNNPVMFNDPMGDKAALKVKLHAYYAGSGATGDQEFQEDGGGGLDDFFFQVGLSMQATANNYQQYGAFYVGHNVDPNGQMGTVENGLRYDTNVSSSQIAGVINDALLFQGSGLGIAMPSSQTQSSPANINAGKTGNSGSTTMYAMSGGMNYVVDANQGGFPSFATLEKNYPMPYEPGPYSQSLYFNQCAIRLSIALTKSGVSLKGVRNRTNPGGQTYTPNGEVLGAYNLAKFLSGPNVLGSPVQYDGMTQDIPSLLNGQTGIIFFQGFLEDGSRSDQATHIDLWNGSGINAPYYNQMMNSRTIWFWPVK